MLKKRLSALFCAAAMFCTTLLPTSSIAAADTSMRDITTMELVQDMGIGINLGNTLESAGDWIAEYGDGTTASYETAWGSPVITREIIQGYKNEGFGVLRIPVAWSNMMVQDGSYKINEEWMARVTEVVDMTLDVGLYAIINIHWDNGWVNKFPENKTECMKRYTTMWTQISENFKDYGDHLMFESQNEELGWETVWNKWGGTQGKDESYALVNEINQTFVDIVRKSGGNNAKRHLLISGYNTGIDVTCDPMFKMPNDPAGRCAVSVHYYTPAGFAILEEDADWGKATPTWGSDADFNELNGWMDMMKTNFVDKGIPVIIGEYGCPKKNKDASSVHLFLKSVCEAAYTRNLCPVLWDITDVHYDRSTYKMVDQELKKAFVEISGADISNPVLPTEPPATEPPGETATITPDPENAGIWIVDTEGAEKIIFEMKMAAKSGATGCVGYSTEEIEWEQEVWEIAADNKGNATYEYTVPKGVDRVQLQIWWPADAELTAAFLIMGEGGNDPTETPTQETTEKPTEAPTQATTQKPTEAPTQAPAEVAYGDVDENGAVDILDVIVLNKNLLGVAELSEQGKQNADVDLDGKPTSADSLCLLKYVVKLITVLPVK
ncbi:MAG: cellulase family glycosylhydrolase [Oscillospiraceae bacterium]|nr:cellulase family glycosylhydrolase [Oscillospiraceae bacterium]